MLCVQQACVAPRQGPVNLLCSLHPRAEQGRQLPPRGPPSRGGYCGDEWVVQGVWPPCDPWDANTAGNERRALTNWRYRGEQRRPGASKSASVNNRLRPPPLGGRPRSMRRGWLRGWGPRWRGCATATILWILRSAGPRLPSRRTLPACSRPAGDPLGSAPGGSARDAGRVRTPRAAWVTNCRSEGRLPLGSLVGKAHFSPSMERVKC